MATSLCPASRGTARLLQCDSGLRHFASHANSGTDGVRDANNADLRRDDGDTMPLKAVAEAAETSEATAMKTAKWLGFSYSAERSHPRSLSITTMSSLPPGMAGSALGFAPTRRSTGCSPRQPPFQSLLTRTAGRGQQTRHVRLSNGHIRPQTRATLIGRPHYAQHSRSADGRRNSKADVQATGWIDWGIADIEDRADSRQTCAHYVRSRPTGRFSKVGGWLA